MSEPLVCPRYRASLLLKLAELALGGCEEHIQVSAKLIDAGAQLGDFTFERYDTFCHRLGLVAVRHTEHARVFTNACDVRHGLFDVTLSHDIKSAIAAANTGQPVPLAAPRSSLARDAERIVAALRGPGARQKRKILGLTIG